MIRRWVTVEEEVSKLTSLINKGTDQDLVDYLQPWTPENIRWAVTHITKEGDTVLHLAAVRQREAGVVVMLQSQAEVNGRDGHERSPLHACLCHNSLSSARLLISFGANVNEIVCRQTRESLLHRMIKANRPLAVELLMEMGTSLTAVTKDGDTPLHFAARHNRLKIARFLSLMGADVNAANLNKETPLHVAIANHSLDVAKALVKNKVNVTVKDKGGMTSLHLAVLAGNVELVRVILDLNSTQVNSKEWMLGRTPLLLACSASCPKMVALLLSYGADITLTTHYRKSVLHVAATSGTVKVLWTIMKRTPNLNLLATSNQTPLHCAVLRGKANIVKMLLDASVNPNMKDIDGNTALHMAAQAGNNDIINILMQHGAQVNVTNMQQQTALHLASISGHAMTCALLVNVGCDPNILDLRHAKAQSYLNKFLGKDRSKLEAETGIKMKVTGVRFRNPDYAHLQGIQESTAGEAESEDINRSNPLQQSDNKSGEDDDMHVFVNTTTQANLNNSIESNKLAEEMGIQADRLTKERSTNTRSDYKQTTAEDTQSDSDESPSHDEKTGNKKTEACGTKRRKSRARITKSMNNTASRRTTTKRMVGFNSGRSHGDVIKQESTDQRIRKQGIII